MFDFFRLRKIIKDTLFLASHPQLSIISPLDVDAILSALHLETDDPNVLEKFNWIKERIFPAISAENESKSSIENGDLEKSLLSPSKLLSRENFTLDPTWNKRFVSLTTGQKSLNFGDTIRIFSSTDGSFSVQPRFGALFIPPSPSTKEEFFEKLEELMKTV